MNDLEFERLQVLPNYLAGELSTMSTELKNAYKKEKTMLDIIDRRDDQIKQLKRELNALKKEHKMQVRLSGKYNALANSKLGKLQLKYWTIRAAVKG